MVNSRYAQGNGEVVEAFSSFQNVANILKDTRCGSTNRIAKNTGMMPFRSVVWY